MNILNRFTLTWVSLIVLTLASAVIAEAGDPSVLAVIFVGVVTTIKGNLVIDQLMGLRSAPQPIRWMMRSYFYIFPPLMVFTLLIRPSG